MTETVKEPGTALAQRSSQADWIPRFVVPVREMAQWSDDITEFQRTIMKKGVHYGPIPGAGTKSTLFKAGAELLLSRMVLHAADPIILDSTIDYGEVDSTGRVIREGLIRFSVRRDIYKQIGPSETERIKVASGLGSCTSREKKYRWRGTTKRQCPQCEKQALVKVRRQGGGWFCAPEEGCRAFFKLDDERITSQPEPGKALNPDLAEIENTILKMASKRALIDGALLATGCSNVFSQDVGDEEDDDGIIEGEIVEEQTPTNNGTTAQPAEKAPQRQEAPQEQQPEPTRREPPRAASGGREQVRPGPQRVDEPPPEYMTTKLNNEIVDIAERAGMDFTSWDAGLKACGITEFAPGKTEYDKAETFKKYLLEFEREGIAKARS